MTFLFFKCQIIDSISDKIRNIKNNAIYPNWKPSFVHSSCAMKFADTCVMLESLTRKLTVQRNFKTQGAKCITISHLLIWVE